MQIRTTTMPAAPRMSKSRQQRSCVGTGHTRNRNPCRSYAVRTATGAWPRGLVGSGEGRSMVGRHNFTGYGLGVRRGAITRADRRQAALTRIPTSAGTRERDGSARQWFERLRDRDHESPGGLREAERRPGFDISLEGSEPWFSAEVEVERLLEVDRRLM